MIEPDIFASLGMFRHSLANLASSQTLSIFPLKQALALGLADPSAVPPGLEAVGSFKLNINGHHETINAFLSNLPDEYDIVLGRPWLNKHQPDIQWGTGAVTFNHERCSAHHPLQDALAVAHSVEGKPRPAIRDGRGGTQAV